MKKPLIRKEYGVLWFSPRLTVPVIIIGGLILAVYIHFFL